MECSSYPCDLDEMRFGDGSDSTPSESSYRACSPTPMAPSPPSHYTHAFERDFCTNFTCCGQSLADLHLLLDHFEEAHVLVLGANGRPTYPSPYSHPIADDYRDYCPESSPPSPTISNTPSSDGPDSPCSASFVLDYPHTSTPPVLSGNRDPIRYKSHNASLFYPSVDEDVLTLSTIEFDFDSRKSQLWESLSVDDDVPLYYPLCGGTSFDGDGSREEELEDFVCRSVVEQIPPERRSGAEEVLPVTATVVSPSKKKAPGSKPSTPSRWRKGAREKLRCPRVGCIKTYLNANGLKYHIERGTCEMGPKGGKQ